MNLRARKPTFMATNPKISSPASQKMPFLLKSNTRDIGRIISMPMEAICNNFTDTSTAGTA